MELDEFRQDLQSPDPELRLAAIYSLSKLELQPAADLIAQGLADPDSRVRSLAQRSLSRLQMLGITPTTEARPHGGPPVRLTLGGSVATPVVSGSPSQNRNTPPISEPLPELRGAPASRAISKNADGSIVFSLRHSPSPTPVRQSEGSEFPESVPPLSSDSRDRNTSVRKGKPGTTPQSPTRAKQAIPVTSRPSSSPPASPLVSLTGLAKLTTQPNAPDRPQGQPDADRTPTGLSHQPQSVQPAPPVSAPAPASVPVSAPTPAPAPTHAPGSASASRPLATAPAPAAIIEVDAPEWLRRLQPEDIDDFPYWFSQLEQKERLHILAAMEGKPGETAWSGVLEDILSLEQDVFVVSKILKVYGHHRGAGALAILDKFLEHADHRVTANAIEALSLSQGKEELERIIHFLDHPDSRISATAAKQLWATQPEMAMTVVRRMASSSRVWERDAAEFALASSPLDEGKVLLQTLQKQNAKTVKRTKGAKSEPEESANGLQNDATAAHKGIIGKILFFPVAVGLERPVPLWEFCLCVLAVATFYFWVALPVVDWMLPPPPSG